MTHQGPRALKWGAGRLSMIISSPHPIDQTLETGNQRHPTPSLQCTSHIWTVLKGLCALLNRSVFLVVYDVLLNVPLDPFTRAVGGFVLEHFENNQH